MEKSIEYTMEEAITEAKRCLRCPKPACVEGCPIRNYIPEFIFQLSKGNMGEAREILAKRTNLPSVCGRVCPHEKQCEGHCILNKKNKPIKIGQLEMFVADFDSEMHLIKEPLVSKIRGKVAVIGSGPAGLTVAGDLAREGFNVVVYESEREAGGVLLYGIPEFRLPARIVKKEIEKIAFLGVTFMLNTQVGPELQLNDLMAQNFDAVFIGTGTALSKILEIPGYDKKNILQSSYFLRMVSLYNQKQVDRDEVPVAEGETVIVIGAGNVGMDASRTAIRMGAKAVTVVYHRAAKEMTALDAEYQGALADGVQFSFETDTKAFIGKNETATGIKVLIKGVEKELHADKILLAVGSKPADRIVKTAEDIFVDNNGYIITKERPYGMSSKQGVFAGGDVVHQPATVVMAMKEAKKVAEGMAAYVDAKKLLGL